MYCSRDHNYSSRFNQQYEKSTQCPQYILSDNGTGFKNSLMDQVLQQLGIDRIFSAPYHPQSNGKLEFFHKYWKPTLKKLCEKDPANWDKYLNQVLASYRITPNLATAESPFFLVYDRDPNLPLHQLLEPMQHFLGGPDSGMLNLETHRLALAIAKNIFLNTDHMLHDNFQLIFNHTLFCTSYLLFLPPAHHRAFISHFLCKFSCSITSKLLTN